MQPACRGMRLRERVCQRQSLIIDSYSGEQPLCMYMCTCQVEIDAEGVHYPYREINKDYTYRRFTMASRKCDLSQKCKRRRIKPVRYCSRQGYSGSTGLRWAVDSPQKIYVCNYVEAESIIIPLGHVLNGSK